MNTHSEHEQFNRAIATILRADPKAVKEAMEREKQENAEIREAQGQRKRGRKPKAKSTVSPSAHALSAKD